MTALNKSLVKRLSEAESPRACHGWQQRDSYYVTACRATAEDIPGLIEIACKWSNPDWDPDEPVGIESEIDEECADLLPVTAWRTLAELRADEAVEPLVEMLRELDDEFDDWSCQELPHVFGRIGESALGPLKRLASDTSAHRYARSTAIHGLRHVAEHHPNCRDRVVAFLIELMGRSAEHDIELNSCLMMDLVEMGATEAAEAIERAFAANAIDTGMMGDWEDVRQELGVKGLGLPMPENPYSSLDELRREWDEHEGARGVFNDRGIFSGGELDYAAAEAYRERAWNAFAESPEGKQIFERHEGLYWHQGMLEFGLSYLGEIVDEMSLASVHEYVFEHVPRKVSAEPSKAAVIIEELAMFWQFLARAYEWPEAKRIAKWLQRDGLADELKKELDDPANFGPAKSMVMRGKAAGFDMTTQQGLQQFAAIYNQSLLARRSDAASVGKTQPLASADSPPTQSVPLAPPGPIRSGPKVGRNDPCPCGSGKKYKKCCL